MPQLGTLEESAAGDEDPQEGTIMASDEAWRSVVGSKLTVAQLPLWV
jgi:hypothetical protein